MTDIVYSICIHFENDNTHSIHFENDSTLIIRIGMRQLALGILVAQCRKSVRAGFLAAVPSSSMQSPKQDARKNCYYVYCS